MHSTIRLLIADQSCVNRRLLPGIITSARVPPVTQSITGVSLLRDHPEGRPQSLFFLTPFPPCLQILARTYFSFSTMSSFWPSPFPLSADILIEWSLLLSRPQPRPRSRDRTHSFRQVSGSSVPLFRQAPTHQFTTNRAPRDTDVRFESMAICN